jgi:hypothetical protein
MDKQIYRLIGKATTLAACAPARRLHARPTDSRAGWPTASGRAATSSHRRLGSATPPREQLAQVRAPPRSRRARRFLYQMDHQGQREYVPNPVLSKALDVLFLLHADHELNASWSVARAHRVVWPAADDARQHDRPPDGQLARRPVLCHRVGHASARAQHLLTSVQRGLRVALVRPARVTCRMSR